MNNQPLLVYNASAGSGKTFKLVTYYISLLLSSKTSRKFKSIAAMTFTNKAALEMKNRIIEYLYLLKTGEGSVQSVIDEIQKNINIEQAEIQKRASIAFKEILHAYEDFQVSTIDKFNLKLIRSFKKDLEISGDFEVIIEEKELHETVVDLLLDKIGLENENELSRLMLRYAESNIDFGEQWNFRNSLIQFCEIISKEKNKLLIEQLHEQDLSYERHQKLIKKIKSLEAIFLEKAKFTHKLYLNLHIDVQKLPGKSGAHKEIIALGELEDIPGSKSSGSLFNKSLIENCLKEDKIPVLSQELAVRILELHELHLNIYQEYVLLQKFRSNYFNMALLKLLSNAMKNYQKEQRVIPISDFNKLIGNLVKDEYAPFIYERIGTRLEHFLLDEFQDTSRLQWSNLIPLVDEAISYERSNLIVGDPKQSIYRFNNGLAEQFIALPGIYNPENDPNVKQKSDHFISMGSKKALDFNYRSSKNIVYFNNTFFKHLKDSMNERSKLFYADYEQKIISTKPGYVSIKSFEDKVAQSDLNKKILSIIQECLADGYSLGDIAILTETKKEGNQLANFLTEKKIAVVSSDSILLKNSPDVKLIMAYLNLRQKPSDKTYAKRFCEFYLRSLDPNFLQKYLGLFEEVNNNKGEKRSIFNLEKFISTYFGNKDDFFFEYQSLYNLLVKLCKLLDLEELHNPYVHHLLDLAFEFQINRDGKLKSFLEYFELKKEKLALQLPKSDHAVEILTIHKSKGLEFPIVILPELDFDLQNKGFSKFLVKVEDKIVYTSLSKNSEVEEISKYTEEELESIFIDKLNLVYVALTRPKERLYGFITSSSKGMAKVLDKSLSLFIEQEETEFGRTLTLGVPNKCSTKHKTKPESMENYTPKLSPYGKLEPNLVPTRLKELEKSEEIRYGIMFHDILSKIDLTDIDVFDLNESFPELGIDTSLFKRIDKELHAFLNTIRNLGFLDDLEKAYTESEILVDASIVHRPDVILYRKREVNVIEFKTGVKRSAHLNQIQTYMKHIAALVPKEKILRGYLYYTSTNEMMEVLH